MTLKDNNILILQDLTVGYKTKQKDSFTISGINLGIKSGELIGLIGENGSGKSTLLRSVAGLQQVISGEVLINGININDLSKRERAKKIAYVSTELLNVNNLRVFDLIALGRFPYTDWFGNLQAKDRDLINKAIIRVRLEEISGKYFSELSDGQKQRVMIARALAQDTDIIVLDEPTAFLDMPGKYEIVNLLHDIAYNDNKAVLFSVHDINIALTVADVLWMFEDNKIVWGAPEDMALNGTLGRIFEKRKLKFNYETGEINLPKITDKSICIEGDGIEKTWTIKALNRLNFKISCNKSSNIFVHVVNDNNNIHWTVTHKSMNETYNSIYELSLCLRNLNI